MFGIGLDCIASFSLLADFTFVEEHGKGKKSMERLHQDILVAKTTKAYFMRQYELPKTECDREMRSCNLVRFHDCFATVKTHT